MKRNLAMLGVAAVLAWVLAGCSSSPTTACDGPANAVTICANGKPIDFSKAKNAPHKHETGSIYAPAKVLGDGLGVPVEAQVSADGKSAKVTVNGKAFEPTMVKDAKGVHVHDGEAFVPVREFAGAAGLKLDMNADKGTAGFAK